ncbi:hypothetical protein AVEN_242870-1 [Araneus ventricosus]|uniref:CCHC-type domain-containing protein n=1 Tax=Araneus ventricosus TaxID=182803 RepID=A0A4Y2R646_ARAVE|nr:hypothetical protein AVEN_242870-1 [Araneus ventricosus]
MSETSSVADSRDTLELEPPHQEVTEQGQEENELEASIRITSAHSLNEPSQYEEMARVTTAAITKITAVLVKARMSSDNRKLVQAELETLASVLFDKVEENGSLKAQVVMLKDENAALHARVAAPIPQGPQSQAQELAPQQQAPKSYSAILKEKARKRPPPRHVSLVYPRSEETSSEEVKDTLLQEVDLSKAKLGIKNIRKISKGGVAIECRSNKDLGKLLDEINANAKISATLEARIPAKKLPRVILYDVERNRTKCHWVLEAQPTELKKILKKGKLAFEWSKLSLRKFVRPTRCYRCNNYGHISTRCEANETCPCCGEEGHKGQDCEQPPNCTACTAANKKHSKGYDTGHAVTHGDCPTYLREIAELKKRINYGQ